MCEEEHGPGKHAWELRTPGAVVQRRAALLLAEVKRGKSRCPPPPVCAGSGTRQDSQEPEALEHHASGGRAAEVAR